MSLSLAAVFLPGVGTAIAAAPATCAGDPATLTGTADADRLVGTGGRDVIAAGAGDDTITGLGGDDVVCAGFGADTVYAGPGFDWVDTGRRDPVPSADVVYGGLDLDTILMSNGADRAYGGADSDTLLLRGLRAGTVADGGPGLDDVSYDGPAATGVRTVDLDLVSGIGRFGARTVTVSRVEHAFIDLPTTVDRVNLAGTDARNVLVVLNATSITIRGRDGNDDLGAVARSGGLGPGTALVGGPGDDDLSLDSSAAQYTLDLDRGALSRAGVPIGVISAEYYSLRMVSADFRTPLGSAYAIGTELGDEVFITARAVRIDGRAGRDQLVAGSNSSPAAAVIYAGPDNDVASGTGGSDLIVGGDGLDTLYGHAGDDRLLGGSGPDTADGGEGTDTCLAEVVSDCEPQSLPDSSPARRR